MGKSSFDKAYRDGYQDGRKGRGSNYSQNTQLNNG